MCADERGPRRANPVVLFVCSVITVICVFGMSIQIYWKKGEIANLEKRQSELNQSLKICQVEKKMQDRTILAMKENATKEKALDLAQLCWIVRFDPNRGGYEVPDWVCYDVVPACPHAPADCDTQWETVEK